MIHPHVPPFANCGRRSSRRRASEAAIARAHSVGIALIVSCAAGQSPCYRNGHRQRISRSAYSRFCGSAPFALRSTPGTRQAKGNGN
ncbi:hypothetical protein Mapa_003590 [Marchantia paleacea]|nr:hypothetical protein Mapa_003590 [Marchantia paleacea]